MLKDKLTLLFLLLLSFYSTAQKLELDKVTKGELSESKNQNDTTSSATFLFKKARTIFKYEYDEGFVSYTEFQIKLKIYKKDGLEWANFRIPYYVGYEKLEDESIKIESAFTYNLENDKIVKNKVTSEGKFVEQVNEYWKVKSVTFPNVKERSIIELKFTLKTENLNILPDFQFQYDIPVNNAEYITEIPEMYIYKGIRIGFVEVSNEEKLEYVTKSYDTKENGLLAIVRGSVSLSYNQIKTVYTVKNIPAIREESYVNNIDNYRGKIVHELQIVRMPGKEPKQIATTWEDVAKSIFDDKDFSEAINKFDYFTSAVKPLLNEASTAEEKTRKVFNFVKSTMNWNGKYGYYPRNKMNEAFQNKVGNVAEINLMLVSMLRMSGINANPVLISTRDNGIGLFPNRTLFNYVIVAAEIEGKTILLDATSKYSDFNVLPVRDLNWSGRLIKKDGTSAEIDLMPKSNSKNSTVLMGTINSQGEISGKVRNQYFDYNAFTFREKYNKIAEQSYIGKLEKQQQGLEIGKYEVQNNDDLTKPITENYDFTSPNSVEIIGDKMYLSPLLFFVQNDNPFKQEARKYPVDFAFPNQDRYNITLTIPDGYVVETLPAPKAVAMPDNIGSFKYQISNSGNKVQLMFVQDTNEAVIGPEYYEALQNFYKEIINKQTEKVVLKKA